MFYLEQNLCKKYNSFGTYTWNDGRKYEGYWALGK